MPASIDFLLRLLDQQTAPRVCTPDIGGVHAPLLRACQSAGFLATEPDTLDVPACTVCGEGVPYRVFGVLRCNRCRSRLEPESQLCWRLDTAGFLGWMARAMGLRGGVRRVEPGLWHLGVWGKDGEATECFFQRPGPLSEMGQGRLEAYRSVVVLHGLSRPAIQTRPGLRPVPLPRVLVWDETKLAARPLDESAECTAVRFDPASGALWAGDRKLGEAPVGSQECHLLACVAENLDRYVSYSDLRREVLRRSGGRGTRDEATFCHELKRRIKKRFVPEIDLVLTTNNKASGYRLRASLDGLC
jgi:hypothetical protein